MRKISLLALAATLLGGALFSAAFSARAAALPELPRQRVDLAYPSVTGRSIQVKSGDNLQNALNSANPGDELVLEAGAVFTGPLTLKKKSGDAWIVIRGSRLSELPSFGSRVNPSHASLMPKIVSPGRNEGALRTEDGAHHYWIAGVEFAKQNPSAVETNLIHLGSGGQTSLGQVPHHLVLDRVYAHGDAASNLRRCVTLNSGWAAVVNSHLSDCHEIGADAQAIGGWNGPGPYLIENNHLEGSGENILFGGADPRIPDLIPSDIEIRRNHLVKPLSWKIGHPSYAGKAWTIKNLFELKSARRVLVEGNFFENSWTHGQTGPGILLKSTNQDGRCGWCQTSDVTFVNNIVRNVEEGLVINASEGRDPKPPAVERVLVRNSVFDASRRPFSIYNGVKEVTIENSVGLGGHSLLMGDGGSGKKNVGFAVKNSVLERGTYGVGAGSVEGSAYLNLWFEEASFENNLLLNSKGASNLAARYPSGTKVAEGADVFVNRAENDYGLRVSYPGIGADMGALRRALQGTPSASPAPANPAPQSPVQPGPPGGSAPSPAPQDGRALLAQIAQLQSQIAALQSQLRNSRGTAENRVSRNLSFGMTGSADVRLLQEKLSRAGTYSGPVTGNFLGLTRAGVVAFQRSRGLPATGYVGPLTRAELANY